MVHESWYLQFILNLHISSYLLVSLAHPLLLSFVPFSMASDGRRVWSRRDGKLNANRAGVLWEDQDSISAAGKSVLPLLLPTYISITNHQTTTASILIKQHPSIPLEFFIWHFEALWNQLAHLPAPRAKFEEPVGILPRASHLQQNSQPSICGRPIFLGRASFCGGPGICGDRYLWV